MGFVLLKCRYSGFRYVAPYIMMLCVCGVMLSATAAHAKRYVTHSRVVSGSHARHSVAQGLDDSIEEMMNRVENSAVVPGGSGAEIDRGSHKSDVMGVEEVIKGGSVGHTRSAVEDATQSIARLKNKLPRFVSTKSDDVNLRNGPGQDYPLKFHIRCKWYPLEVIAEFGNWRFVRDRDNHKAWIMSGMISSAHRSAIIMPQVKHIGDGTAGSGNGNKGDNSVRNVPYGSVSSASQSIEYEAHMVVLHTLPNEKSAGVVLIEQGVIVRILKCNAKYCKVAVSGGHIGWVKRVYLWGLYEDETI